jgi:hypothetical protein
VINPELDRDNGIVTVSPEGKLEKTDFEQLSRLVDPYIEQNGKINGLLIYASDFPGWKDLAALISYIQFIDDHHKKIKRVAVVTDETFLSLLPSVAEHFVNAEVKNFRFDDREQAESWLRHPEN